MCSGMMGEPDGRRYCEAELWRLVNQLEDNPELGPILDAFIDTLTNTSEVTDFTKAAFFVSNAATRWGRDVDKWVAEVVALAESLRSGSGTKQKKVTGRRVNSDFCEVPIRQSNAKKNRVRADEHIVKPIQLVVPPIPKPRINLCRSYYNADIPDLQQLRVHQFTRGDGTLVETLAELTAESTAFEDRIERPVENGYDDSMSRTDDSEDHMGSLDQPDPCSSRIDDLQTEVDHCGPTVLPEGIEQRHDDCCAGSSSQPHLLLRVSLERLPEDINKLSFNFVTNPEELREVVPFSLPEDFFENRVQVTPKKRRRTQLGFFSPNNPIFNEISPFSLPPNFLDPEPPKAKPPRKVLEFSNSNMPVEPPVPDVPPPEAMAMSDGNNSSSVFMTPLSMRSPTERRGNSYEMDSPEHDGFDEVPDVLPPLRSDSPVLELKATKTGRKVLEWHHHIAPQLEKSQKREEFTIKRCAATLIKSFPPETTDFVPFGKLVSNQPKMEIARSFCGVLHMADTKNVELKPSGDMDVLDVKLLKKELPDFSK